MAIKKQDFYEGAAIHLLAKTGTIRTIRYEAPYFVLNESVSVYLKHCTRARGPWGFTFVPSELAGLERQAQERRAIVGLVCGGDGVVALSIDCIRRLASEPPKPSHIACHRRHGQHYSVNGPEGPLETKIPPSGWTRILADDSTS